MKRQSTLPERHTDPRLGRIRSIARLLDSAFRVPGTAWRFGVDPILGLVPGAGDAVGAAMGSYLLWLAARAGAPPPVLLRMFGNLAFDALLGAVPLLGDLFDAGWKANTRNLRLLERYLAQPSRTTMASYLMLALLLIGVLAIGAGAVWLAIATVRAILP